ncbi:MAG: ComEA family DNA-binding protein [Chloroflexota bacterium]
MKALSDKRVPLAWLLLAAIVSGSLVIIAKVAWLGTSPPARVFISSSDQVDGPSATRTPFGGEAVTQATPRRTVTPETTTEQVVALSSDVTPAADSVTAKSSQPSATATAVTIAVYISGAVLNPGVYYLPAGSRVDTAIAAAGGALAEADLEQINLAQRLEDEQHIVVARKGEVLPTSIMPANPTAPLRSPTTASQPAPLSKIDLNHATAAELEMLPGIGPALAARIITERETNGPYTTVDDLARVTGIKEAIINKLREFATVLP